MGRLRSTQGLLRQITTTQLQHKQYPQKRWPRRSIGCSTHGKQCTHLNAAEHDPEGTVRELNNHQQRHRVEHRRAQSTDRGAWHTHAAQWGRVASMPPLKYLTVDSPNKARFIQRQESTWNGVPAPWGILGASIHRQDAAISDGVWVWAATRA